MSQIGLVRKSSVNNDIVQKRKILFLIRQKKFNQE